MADRSNGVWLFYLVYSLGQYVLLRVLKWGTADNVTGLPLHEYLRSLPDDAPVNYVRTRKSHTNKQGKKDPRFTNEEINKFENVSEDKYDVTLLHKCIKEGCRDVASLNSTDWSTKPGLAVPGQLEYHVTVIKDWRNTVAHTLPAPDEQNFFADADKFKNDLHAAVDVGKVRYNRLDAEVDQIKQYIKDFIMDVRKKVQSKENFLMETKQVLKEQLKSVVDINPISFLLRDLNIKVDEVYTKLKVSSGKVPGRGTEMDCQDLDLHDLNSTPEGPRMILMKGVAGSGKTTLVKALMHQWAHHSGNAVFRGLDAYDLMFWAECKDSTIDSLRRLLRKRLSVIYNKFGDDLVLTLLKQIEIFVVIDALDERNDQSRELVKNLTLELADFKLATICITSRPEHIEEFQHKIPTEYSLTYAEIIGIPVERRTDFATKYFEKVIAMNNKRDNPLNLDEGSKETLLKQLKMDKQMEHFRLPLNLVFLVTLHLFSHDYPVGELSTQTGLFHGIHKLSIDRLLKDKLATNPLTENIKLDILKTKLNTVLQTIYKAALEGLPRDQLVLSDNAERKVKDKCQQQGLPSDDVISSFLHQKQKLKPSGLPDGSEYATPHKGIQDFYAAFAIMLELKDQKMHQKLSRSSSQHVSRTLRKMLGTECANLKDYTNVLVHLAGLLQVHNLTDHAEEVTTLIWGTGVRTTERLLDLVEDTRSSPATVTAVAQYMSKADDAEDGLTLTDGRMAACDALLPHCKPLKIKVDCSSFQLLSQHQGLIGDLPRHTCRKLKLSKDFRHPSLTPDNISRLNHLVKSQTKLEVVEGQLSAQAISSLPSSVRELWLVVDGADTLLALCNLAPKLTALKCLYVHLPSTSLSALSSLADSSSQLPTVKEIVLYVSDVTESQLDIMSSVVAKLQPRTGYNGIWLPRAKLNRDKIKTLLKRMQRGGVRVVWGPVEVPYDCVRGQDVDDLRQFCKETWNCAFGTLDFSSYGWQ